MDNIYLWEKINGDKPTIIAQMDANMVCVSPQAKIIIKKQTRK